jgi:hypothetical protein
MIADRKAMSALALSFPELARNRCVVDPFDPEVLDRWACSGAPGHGGSCAARFMLSVWSGVTGVADVGKKRASHLWVWNCKRFDLHEALGCWDDSHRAAFVAWACNPWWP